MKEIDIRVERNTKSATDEAADLSAKVQELLLGGKANMEPQARDLEKGKILPRLGILAEPGKAEIAADPGILAEPGKAEIAADPGILVPGKGKLEGLGADLDQTRDKFGGKKDGMSELSFTPEIVKPDNSARANSEDSGAVKGKPGKPGQIKDLANGSLIK